MLLCDQRQSDLLRRNEAKERRNADNDALKFEMLKAWGTVLDPSRFSVCCHSPLVSSKRLRALTVVIMDPSFYKVVAFISFITLGWCLRKFNVLKPEAFQAISGLVMFVTLPCTTITGQNKSDRTVETLKSFVERIYTAMKSTQSRVCQKFSGIENNFPEEITFITTQELEDMYPDLEPKERENKLLREKKAVFLMQIGKELKSGQRHDGRAPDYDDWELNGDILVYYPVLDMAYELSSMGIRVDEDSLLSQIKIAGCEDRLELDFHKKLLNQELPYTIGGGIGQSRLCMYMLGKAHIGEVQASVWPDDMRKTCEEKGIKLL